MEIKNYMKIHPLLENWKSFQEFFNSRANFVQTTIIYHARGEERKHGEPSSYFHQILKRQPTAWLLLFNLQFLATF